MALAILDLLAYEQPHVRARIDTGTNRYYQVKVGHAVQQRGGIDWIDDVVFASPVRVNEAGGELFNSAREVSLRIPAIDERPAYLQLFTFKTPDGTSPAFSQVLKLGADFEVDDPSDVDISLSRSTAMNLSHEFQPPRRVPCRSAAEVYARQTSWGDLLAEAVRVAGPALLQLIGTAAGGSAPAGSTATGSPAAGSGSTPAAALNGQAEAIAQLLQTLLGALQPQGGAPVRSATQSRFDAGGQNRFHNGHLDGAFARPFIFGVDDALFAALIGPVVQILPQLMNAANQKRAQITASNNALVASILSDVNRRLLLERLAEAQRQPAAAGGQATGGANLDQLIQLLQQAPAANGGTAPSPAAPNGTPATPPPAPPPAAPLSIGQSRGRAYQFSTRAVLSFVLGDPIDWNGTRTVLFAKGQPLQLKLQLNVTDPVPATPLPKAIVAVVFKDSADQTTLFEKTFKQKDVAANTVLPLAFSADETARLPVSRPIAVVAEMRWLTRDGTVHQALGSADFVVVNRYFFKGQGPGASAEHELSDLQQYRAFWNKVWESPLLDAASGSARKKLWKLDANLKYSVLLSPDQPSNGVMDTKLLQGPPDPESVTQAVTGRMKAGIELSLAELNQLLPLLDNQPGLDPEKLEAISTREFARRNAGELVQRLLLKGKARERGLVWIVPIVKLFDLTLTTVQTTDDAGQVLTVGEEHVRFPLPVAARLIGLTSQQDSLPADEAGDEEATTPPADGQYAFEGFNVEFSTKVLLTPVTA